ncbi:hypothetical protein Ccrd_021534 [Cynara cardunculus var. scolymus]|uniref:RRM domain-containing protein n=1 Tax=Cynara cardunculus var. scolymus TaxID=59895 RepID=A0A124SEI3_CYNCS|nr:hypothetical protein Ccrd_021534 [Cynara cardunculus var. scolymus]
MEAQGGQQQWMMSAQPQPQFAYAAPPPPPQPYHQPSSHEEVRTLWIGDLPYWADESYLHSWFAATNEVLSIKVIRNKATGLPEGYGFVEFASHGTAERVLQSYNGTQIPGTELTFRLNWASSGIGERRPDAGPEHSIFVGDLAPDVTDHLLQETFRTQYPSVRGAKVVTDPNTGRSKGYGFVKFADEMEKNRAMTEMNGIYCSTRPMRISAATPKKTTVFQQQYVAPKGGIFSSKPARTLGSLSPMNVVKDLIEYMLLYVMDSHRRTSAEEAIQRMHGSQIGQLVVHLSWGKSTTAKQGEGGQDMGGVTGVAPPLEQREEIYDPLATPDVDKLNSAYVAIHGSAILGRPLWQKTSPFSIHA